MFEVEKTADGGAVMTAADGTAVTVPPDVLVKLQDSNAIFSEWKRFLQAFALQNMEHAKALKAECPGDGEYRDLRSKIRLL